MCDRIYQQGKRHDQQQPLDARGLLHKQRRDKEPRIFEAPKAPLGLGLTFVSLNDIGIAQLACVNIGPYHKAGFALLAVPHLLIIRPSTPVELPLDGLDWRSGSRATFTRIAFMFNQAGGRHLVIGPRCRECAQSSLSGLGRFKALGLQVEQLLLDGLIFALLGFAASRLGPLSSGL